jgi:hypothetical protein
LRIRFETFCSASDRDLGAELLREIGVTAATLLQIFISSFVLHRRDVDDFELAGLCYQCTQLLTETHQAGCLTRAGAVCLPFKARVNKFEIEDGSPQSTRLPGQRPRYESTEN